MNLLPTPVRSSLGKKYLMAITGLLLIGFVLGHMAGNLLVFAGPNALNSYAQALKDKPGLLWTARLGLLAVFVVHVLLGLQLTLENLAARPTRYASEKTLQASWASRHMLLTGLVLLAFVVYHLAHFTLGVVEPSRLQSLNGQIVKLDPPRNYLELSEIRSTGTRDYSAEPGRILSEAVRSREDARHDVYSMVIAGFRNPLISISYLAAMVFLALHLWHGGSSFLQSLGINSSCCARAIRRVGPIIAGIVLVGNSAIVVAVWLGIVK